MNPSDARVAAIRQVVTSTRGIESAAVKVIALGGATARVSATGMTYFAKVEALSDRERLGAEKDGLEVLNGTSRLRVPAVIGYGEADSGFAVLLTEWLEFGPSGRADWEGLAEGLAQVHDTTNSLFGYHRDNFIGLSKQINTQSDNWIDFFIEQRLDPQVQMARNNRVWEDGWTGWYDALLVRLSRILPGDVRPALVHGDLWSGNCGFTESAPCIYDPAVYFGHSEVDLAMTRLFGGFPVSFYDAYRSYRPLEKGYEEHFEIYNLYHLLNHLNIFGRSYSSRVGSVLRRYGS